MPDTSDRIEIENVVSPHHKQRVDKTKYLAMRKALLMVLADASAGLTVAEMKSATLPLLPQDLWPAGEKAGWWLKAVQLDLEAKGIIKRVSEKPVRLVSNGEH